MMSIHLQQLWPERVESAWPNQAVTGLCLDSRRVQNGEVFFALKSTSQTDRTAEFIQSALDKGAIAVFSEIDVIGFDSPSVFYCADIRQWVGLLAKRFLQAQHPVPLAQIAAVTGTNGKTTISRLLAELLALKGHATAVMGTTGNGILPVIEPSSHTTVDALHLQQQLYDFAKKGAEYVCLEASSHGLDQGRLLGADIRVAIFSNLTRDHLDYHGTLEAYAEAKSKLFEFTTLTHVIFNKDDDAWHFMQRVAQNSHSNIQSWTYSLLDAQADFYATTVNYSLQGASINLKTPEGNVQIQSPLLGHFNVSNVMAAVAGAMAFGLTLQDIQTFVPQLQGAPGRMQVIADQDRLFVVDYAHTPDALTQVLRSLKHHVTGDGSLWAVFGCGGDRDRGKRPLMTQAALDIADRLLLTADNPRTESVEQILLDMQQGIDIDPSRVQVEADRRLAIRQVVQLAKKGDIVVLAGKGHENYQEIDGVRHWFDDVVELQAALGLNEQVPQGYPA
jgi:UDP-N-acetylmuramoyl-L-alanyl-D-glutamate--2,6-diaminopimelate ligase